MVAVLQHRHDARSPAGARRRARAGPADPLRRRGQCEPALHGRSGGPADRALRLSAGGRRRRSGAPVLGAQAAHRPRRIRHRPLQRGAGEGWRHHPDRHRRDRRRAHPCAHPAASRSGDVQGDAGGPRQLAGEPRAPDRAVPRRALRPVGDVRRRAAGAVRGRHPPASRQRRQGAAWRLLRRPAKFLCPAAGDGAGAPRAPVDARDLLRQRSAGRRPRDPCSRSPQRTLLQRRDAGDAAGRHLLRPARRRPGRLRRRRPVQFRRPGL